MAMPLRMQLADQSRFSVSCVISSEEAGEDLHSRKKMREIWKGVPNCPGGLRTSRAAHVFLDELMRTSAMVLAQLWRGATTRTKQAALRTMERKYPAFVRTEKDWLESGQDPVEDPARSWIRAVQTAGPAPRCTGVSDRPRPRLAADHVEPRRFRADSRLPPLQAGNLVGRAFPRRSSCNGIPFIASLINSSSVKSKSISTCRLRPPPNPHNRLAHRMEKHPIHYT